MRKRVLIWSCLVWVPVAALGADAKKECCFTNVAYSGVCQVTPGEGESCTSILQYLNRPNSVGKNYCMNTTVRGGWKKKSCEAKPKEGTAEGRKSPEVRPAP
jgi:hypothetical protein